MSKSAIYAENDVVMAKYEGKIVKGKIKKVDKTRNSKAIKCNEKHIHYGVEVDPNWSNGVETTVETFLETLRLSDYTDLLLDEGFDDMETLCELTDQNLIDLGFKIGHKRRLLMAIDKINEEKKSPLIYVCEKDIHKKIISKIKAKKMHTPTSDNPIFSEKTSSGKGGYKAQYDEAGYLPHAKRRKKKVNLKDKEYTDPKIVKKKRSKQSTPLSKSKEIESVPDTPEPENESEESQPEEEPEEKSQEVEQEEEEEPKEEEEEEEPEKEEEQEIKQEPEKKTKIIQTKTRKMTRDGKIDSETFFKNMLENSNKKLQVKLNAAKLDAKKDKKTALEKVKTPTRLVVNGKVMQPKKLKKRESVKIQETNFSDAVNVNEFMYAEETIEEETHVEVVDD